MVPSCSCSSASSSAYAAGITFLKLLTQAYFWTKT